MEVVRVHIQNCPCCVLQNAETNASRPDSQSASVYCSHDFLTFCSTTDRYQNIHVITDLFTNYAWRIRTPDGTASVAGPAFWTHVILVFSCPEILHSDQVLEKLSDRWENQPHVVVAQSDHLVYKVRPDGKYGPACVLYNNNLFSLSRALSTPKRSSDPRMWGQ